MSKPDRDSLLLLLFSFLTVQILFYIDEGYYDLRWMKDAGNWFVFLIYLLVIYCCQLVFYHVILRRLKGRSRLILGFWAGCISGILLLVKFIF